MADKKCPQCGLWNTESAMRCDCGYDFMPNTVKESYSATKWQRRSNKLMEITFQNKRTDFEAYYDYMVRKTEQGKRMSKQAFIQWLIVTIMVALLFGSFSWGYSGQWQTGLKWTVFYLIVGGLVNLFMRGFKPIYGSGIFAYRNQNSGITEREKAIFELPKIITIDDDWLEMHNSEVLYRWRWRQVSKIGIMQDFIFIHVGNYPVVYVPMRDFPSKHSFLKFGNKLLELKEKNKGQAIGAE